MKTATANSKITPPKSNATKPTLVKRTIELGEPGPFGKIIVASDGDADSTSIINDGLVQFHVDFPDDGSNLCEIKIKVQFKKKAVECDERGLPLDGGGGTITIGG